MTDARLGRTDVETAIASLVAEAVRERRTLPVHSSAIRIVRDLDCDEDLAPAIAEALSQRCIRSGVIVEFDAI